jgi:predicted Rossmann fold flavoprotein
MTRDQVPSTARIAVIGGGPAGLTAAGTAAERGGGVLLLEAGDRPGRKLLLTGRGRCNLTSTLPLPAFLEAYGPGGRFLRNAYSRFFSDELVRFLEGIGVETARERGGRIYPARGGAARVREALEHYAVSSGTVILPRRRVLRLVPLPGGAYRVTGKDFVLEAERVIVATGGASFPWTGSRGDGYALAESLGHELEPPRPALVPLRCAGTFLPALAGLRLRNVSLSYRPAGKRKSFFGEVHFTDFGISGPAIFLASKEIGLLTEKAPLPVQIDLKPSVDEKTLDARLQRELSAAGRRPLSGVMEGFLPMKLIPVFLDLAGAPADLSASEVRKEVRRSMVRLFKALPLTVTGTLPLERAMVTAGGVRLREVDPATMESRIARGVYFCGELLDVDGSTGGFNLQAAFSTGYLAGVSAAGGGGEEGK